MSKKLQLSAVFVLSVAVITGLTQCSRDNRVLAKIGDHEQILAGAFKKSLDNLIAEQHPDTLTLEMARQNLDDQIESRLMLMAAYHEGMDQDSIMQIKKIDFERDAIFDKIWQDRIVDQIVTEKEIRDFYAKSEIQIDARKIDLYVDADADSSEEAGVLDRARDLIRQVRGGQPFSRLARQYSDDRQTASQGGALNPLWYRLNGDPIIEAAFSMKKGEISEPIRTRSGYAILIIDDIIEENKRTYQEAHSDMRKYILSVKREEANANARAFVDTLWNRQNAAWHDETIDTLTALFSRWEKRGNQLVVIDSLKALPDDFKERKIFSSNEQIFSVKDLTVFFKRHLAQYNRLSVGNRDSFMKLLDREMKSRLIHDLAIHEGLDRDEQVIQQFNIRVEEELIRRKRAEIYGKIQPTPDELQAYYEENKDSKYMNPQKVQIQEILVRSEDLANELLRRIKAGEDFGTLAEKYTTRNMYKKKKGMLFTFARGAMGKEGEKAFQMSVGEIAGPIPTSENKQAIIKLVDIIEPEPRSFKGASGDIRRDFIIEKQDEKRSAWVAQQKKTYPVSVNEALLESIWKTYARKK